MTGKRRNQTNLSPLGATDAKAGSRGRTAQMQAERAAQAERTRRTRRIVVGVGAVVIVALVVAIVVAVVNALQAADEPTVSGEVVAPATAVDGAIPVGEEDAPVAVDLYFDYMCPACGAFEAVNGEDLDRLLEDGTARIDLHVLNFLDPQSGGTQYSTRAGNALATVADQAPEHVWDLHQALYANQPEEGTSGLDDEEIADLALGAGVPEDVVEDFTDGTHRAWVAESNEQAFEAGVQSTPTILIGGEQFTGDWSTPGELAATIEAAAGEQ
ncbi:DsbA family protein [Nocardioides sp. SYSU DS0663]|uniref:DsbA family protein n=1 Tax=Nocardioides sp. SYSU DS0663 TaxID=3416445 RepID=UPI003F4B9F4E